MATREVARWTGLVLPDGNKSCLVSNFLIGLLQGSHFVSQPADGTGARHLQVGFGVHNSMFAAENRCFSRSVWSFQFGSWTFQDSNSHFGVCHDLSGSIQGDRRHTAEFVQDCEVIGWAELCERRKLTAGSCFQLEWLGHVWFEERHAGGLLSACQKKSFLGQGRFHVYRDCGNEH